MTHLTNTIRTSYKRKTEMIESCLESLISCRRKYKKVYCEEIRL
jgi:hypothetical protein